jgi:hypothetical protein
LVWACAGRDADMDIAASTKAAKRAAARMYCPPLFVRRLVTGD